MSDQPSWPQVTSHLEAIQSVLAESTIIGCLTHKDADADSLGSALAFALALRAAGKEAYCIVPSPLPTLLAYLPGFDTVVEKAPALDALFTFDCATAERFGDKQHLLEATAHVVNVDHHISNGQFGTINVIEARASATGQVVYALLGMLGMTVTSDIASNLYAALLTDTGGFRHDNTDEAALRLGADLVACGADAAWIAMKSYKSRSVAQLRLEGMAIAGMVAEVDGALIWSEITQEMLRTADATMQLSEGVIDHLQSIDTMRIAILFKESNASRTKISVRTRAECDATEVCIPFGGGGHRRAAGAEINLPLADAQQAVLQLARDLLAKRVLSAS